MKKNKKPDFDAIKKEYELCYSPDLIDDLILKDIAERNQVSKKTLKDLACAENWREIRDEKNQKILDLQALKESEVRVANLKTATALLDKAWQKLSHLNLADLTVEQAIKMAQLGLKARHQAAGLPNTFRLSKNDNLYPHPVEKTIEASIEKQQLFEKLAKKISADFIREGHWDVEEENKD